MSKREIGIIVALLIAGFIAYEVVLQFGTSPDVDEPVGPSVVEEPSDETSVVAAIVPSVLATELHAALAAQGEVPDLPAGAGLLAIPGNPGHMYFARNHDGRAEVCDLSAAGVEVLWSTDSDAHLEVVGSHATELLLKFVDAPFGGPADAWDTGGFLGLDMEAPGVGTYPSNLDGETVAAVRATIR